MKIRVVSIFFVLFCNITIQASWSLDSIVASASSLGTQASQDASQAALQQALDQSFFLSAGYQAVVSKMKESGVMDRYSNLVATLQSGSDVDQTEMTTVVADLTSLFSSMLSAYSSVSVTTNGVTTAYPKAVIANSANGVYSFYSTILLLYVARLTYLANQINATANNLDDYGDKVTAALQAFADYTNSLNSLIAQFPTSSSANISTTIAAYYDTLPSLAINDYYSQAAQAILPNILSVMTSAKSVLNDQYNQALYAMNMYNSLMATTNLQTVSTGYDSFSDYQSALLTALYTTCSNAASYLSKSIDFVSNSADQNSVFFNDQVTLYTNAVAIFKNATGFSSNYSILNSGLTDAQNKLTAFNSAYNSINSIQQLYDTVVSDMQKSQTASDLSTLLQSIAAPLNNCTTTQAQLTLIGDVLSGATLKTLENKLYKIYYIILLKYLWALFMADTSAGGAEITALYSSLIPDDQTFTADFTTLSNSIQSMYNVCSSTSNKYVSGYSLSNEVTYAIAYANAQAASATTLSAATTSSSATTDFCDLTTLQSVQKLISLLSDFANNFVQLNTALGAISPSALSSLKAMIGKVIGSGLKIDAIYSANGSLASYIPNLATAAGAQTYENLAMGLITYILENKIQTLDTDGAMVCYALLQGYSEYLTDANESYIVSSLKAFDKAGSSEETASLLAAQAQTGSWELINNRMQNTAWLSAIELYLIVYQVQALDKLVTFAEDLAPVLETINSYISTYSTAVNVSDQKPLDLLFLYYTLMSYYTYLPTFTSDDVILISNLSTALSSMTGVFNNSSKTGFFDQLSTMITEFQNETDLTKLASEKQNILDQITIFENYMHAELGWIAGAKLLYNISLAPMLSEVIAADGSTTLSFTSGTNVLTVVVPDLDAVLATAVQSIADTSYNNAQTASDQKDFATAAQKYTDASTAYKTIIDGTEASSEVTQKYYLSLTRAAASSMASVVLRSNSTTVSNIPDVALTYLLSSYSLVVPSVVSSALASNYTTSSLSATASSGSVSLSWTNDQVESVLKMIALNGELTNAGYTYNELYTPGTIQRVSGLDSYDSAQCDAFESTANAYVSTITNALTVGNTVNGTSLIMTASASKDVAGNITLAIQNMPIAPLNGYYTGAPVAESYYSLALLLYNTGVDNVVVGNSVYVPGNDDTAAQNMRLYIAATSLATAELYSQDIATYMSTFATQITNATTTDLQTQLVSDFTSNVTDKFDSIKGALLNTTGGIISYYNQNNETAYAANAQAYAMQMYTDYETSVAKLLVGDPTTKIYASLLNTLNLAYLSQAQFETDATSIAALKDQSAALFKATGDVCGSYKTTVDGTDQYYYKEAAEYYIAAVSQYTSNGNSTQVAATTILENQALAKAAVQEISNYYYIQNNPINYTNASGKTVSTTFTAMVSAYSSFTNQYSLSNSSSMDPNELTLYNETIDLFLDGVMLLTASSSGSTSTTAAASTSTSSTATSTGSTSTTTTTDSTSAVPTAEDEGGLNADIVAFLQTNNVALSSTSMTVTLASSTTATGTSDSADDALAAAKNAISNLGESSSSTQTDPNTETLTIYTVDTSDPTINNQLFAIGISGINTFVAAANDTALAAWLNLLYKAASYIYIDSYLGGITGTTDTDKATDYANKMQTFVQVVQAYGVSLQNPASVYMG